MKHKKNLDDVINYLACVVGVLLVIAGISLIFGCATAPIKEAPKLIALSWDSPARAGWTEYLVAKIAEKKAVLDTAKDIKEFCPKYASLNNYAQTKAWGEFFAALSYYESSWNPKSASVDVGDPAKRDTYSIGLFQVSVVDQEWAGGNLKYSYDQLLTANPNIHLAMQLFTRQIAKTQTIFLDNSSKYRYWAVILRGNKYSKISEIIARVKKHAPECVGG